MNVTDFSRFYMCLFWLVFTNLNKLVALGQGKGKPKITINVAGLFVSLSSMLSLSTGLD